VTARADEHGADFFVPDLDADVRDVSLWYHLRGPYPDRRFQRVEGGWHLRLPRPDVDRLEYLLDVQGHTSRSLLLDATNPAAVPGAFGPHSVVEFPGYSAPAWLTAPAPAGRYETVPVAGVSAQVWSPAGTEPSRVCPLLVAHDGPELERYASLTRYVAAMVADGRLPPVRVALLAPGDRDAEYSASPAYARLLTGQVLPALRAAVPTRGLPVLMGVSLGALAAFHAEWSAPGSVGGLFLGSGSFFQDRLDPQESGYARFWRIVAAVTTVLDAPEPPSRPPVMMVCGAAEENLANNHAFAGALRRLGYPVALAEVRDGHTWVGWRDTFDPYLTTLLHTAAGSGSEH
jgi:enterochelin esterase family protein